MTAISPKRDFALEVVGKLRAAGFIAYWAGGCVRDQLLGREPKDYDVATDATPTAVRHLFGRRTIPVGAAFGVMAVVGGKQKGTVEVVTFRQDAQYSDGRHPDSVTFATPKEDALRRDFTINGLFFDPFKEEVIDFVDGEADLARGIVRAIGNPRERFAEDKLRMLRAVRFAATFAFEIEQDTLRTVQEMSAEITVVSIERITQELTRMLTHENRRHAAELLVQTGLWREVLPELAAFADYSPSDPIKLGLDMLALLVAPSFSLVLAALAVSQNEFGSNEKAQACDAPFPIGVNQEASDLRRESSRVAQTAQTLGERLKLARKQIEHFVWLVEQFPAVVQARNLPWPRLQRILIAPGVEELLALLACHEQARGGQPDETMFCREKLALPAELLNPPPVLSGDDLISHGVPRGKRYREILDHVRDEQLMGRVHDKAQALCIVDQMTGGQRE